jgi:hypothetical protein
VFLAYGPMSAGAMVRCCEIACGLVFKSNMPSCSLDILIGYRIQEVQTPQTHPSESIKHRIVFICFTKARKILHIFVSVLRV